ncbi:putative RNA-directed DNA polymerase [Senna tora]|uniref:Putative RNA-directed DNA polymerase n=1 Tax=Senna tora TaxID=362788 RepID=A0A834XHV7_9FABA|nr:putative RNA-directed DNA polymerase [Senna tora]
MGNVAEFNECWPHIDRGEWDSINTPFTEEEITKAVFSIGGFKASASDGFPVSFYH